MAQTFLFLSIDGNIEYSSNSEYNDMIFVARNDTYMQEENDQSVSLTQAEVNKLTQELKLLKESAQLLS